MSDVAKSSEKVVEAYAVHMHDGRVLRWWGEGIFDAAHRAGYGSGIFDQIKYAEIIGKVEQKC